MTKLLRYKGVTGYTTLHRNGHETVANSALFFLLIGVDATGDHWKHPIQYELTNGFRGEDMKEVIENILTETLKVHINVRGVVFDGLPANITMANALGANLDVNNLLSNFQHPSSGSPVYIFVDAPHMEKFARNLLGEKKEIWLDGFNAPAKWDHIVMLQEFQKTHNIRLGKLSYKHVAYKDNIMKVSLAAQTLSKSTADSLQYMQMVLKLNEVGITKQLIYNIF